MNVYIQPPITGSRALDRVTAALQRYAPEDVVCVASAPLADVVVHHVVGRHDQVQRQIVQQQKPYALIQYCVRSTQRPYTGDWLDLWTHARLVWSYYDLKALCAEDGVSGAFSHYHRPLGVERSVFSPSLVDFVRPFVIASSGRAWTNESVRECVLAARKVGRKAFHLGQPLPQARGSAVCETGLSDADLVARYRQCDYVSGLRRGEGFELPAAEGLLCGARPVLFERPHYRNWFGTWAEYIPEGDRASVIASLVDLFKRPVRIVTERERMEAAEQFDWSRIVSGFWSRLR